MSMRRNVTIAVNSCEAINVRRLGLINNKCLAHIEAYCAVDFEEVIGAEARLQVQRVEAKAIHLLKDEKCLGVKLRNCGNWRRRTFC